MRCSRQTQWLILLAVLAAATVFVARPPVRTIVGSPDLRLELPARVGAYKGEDVLYCQNEQCQKRILVADGKPPEKCPVCGGALSPISLGERQLLPADTIVVKKNYTAAILPPIAMSIVVSGSEQKSIHRPQQCLPAQGLMIEGGSVLNVPIEGRPPLRVTVLPVRRQGASGNQRSDFAYWFVGNNRETESYAKELLWTSLDRVTRRVNQRWAYVSILRARAPGATEAQSLEQLSRFISGLYPALRKR